MARQRSAEELRVLREEFMVKANATFDSRRAGIRPGREDWQASLLAGW